MLHPLTSIRGGLTVRRITGLVALVAALQSAGGCAPGEAAGADALPDSYPGQSQLVQAVLEALESGNRAALERMRVTREEYETRLWPYLPESQSLTFEFAWDLNDRNSRKSLDHALEVFTGQKFALVEVRFTEPVEEYPEFTVYLGARVIVRRLSDGKVGELPVLDAIVELNGRWKLLNFDE